MLDEICAQHWMKPHRYIIEESGLFVCLFALVRSPKSQCTLDLHLENPQQVGFNEGDLEIFRPKVILDFQLILSLQFQFNYKKWFCKETLFG
jgi:hypothetical protein